MKRTLDNCSLIQRMVIRGLGEPIQRDGRCMGYARSEYDDEPCETCKHCPLQESYEGSENDGETD